MTGQGRIADYLYSLEGGGDDFSEELRSYAEDNGIPIVLRETESFLKTMVKILKPRRILEIGAATGYSSICMAKACDAGIVTIENYEKRIAKALQNIKEAGLEERIELRAADAGEELKKLAAEGSSFELIFLDAAKGQYLIWLPELIKLMRKGSVLIADNVLQDGTVAESRFTVARRDRTTHQRMREFLYQIKHHPLLESSVMNIGDGVSMSVMI